jgi:phospholipid/cholesterol/gamma-HCH transport system permease protein
MSELKDLQRPGLHRNILVLNILSVARQSAWTIISGRLSYRDFINQLYTFLMGSWLIVGVCVAFVGIVISIEYSYHIKLIIGNDTLIPGFAMVMLTRELAPAITALLIVSKMGAAMAAELGAMKGSEQLDAYRLLGISPVALYVAPRVAASTLTLIIMTMFALVIALLGSWFATVNFLHFTSEDFFLSLFAFTTYRDFILCFTKAAFFGWSIPVVACTLGFRAGPGAEGVGLCTTDAVVYTSIWIIIFDFVITYFWTALG